MILSFESFNQPVMKLINLIILSILCVGTPTFVSSCGKDEPSSGEITPDDNNSSNEDENGNSNSPNKPGNNGLESNTVRGTIAMPWSWVGDGKTLELESNLVFHKVQSYKINIDYQGMIHTNIFVSGLTGPQIIDVGPVGSLDEITDVPMDDNVEWKSKAEAIVGHGYIIKYPLFYGFKKDSYADGNYPRIYYQDFYYYPDRYARLYVSDQYEWTYHGNGSMNGETYNVSKIEYEKNWHAPVYFGAPKFRDSEHYLHYRMVSNAMTHGYFFEYKEILFKAPIIYSDDDPLIIEAPEYLHVTPFAPHALYYNENTGYYWTFGLRVVEASSTKAFENIEGDITVSNSKGSSTVHFYYFGTGLE